MQVIQYFFQASLLLKTPKKIHPYFKHVIIFFEGHNVLMRLNCTVLSNRAEKEFVATNFQGCLKEKATLVVILTGPPLAE